jgi:hypothetical protein
VSSTQHKIEPLTHTNQFIRLNSSTEIYFAGLANEKAEEIAFDDSERGIFEFCNENQTRIFK